MAGQNMHPLLTTVPVRLNAPMHKHHYQHHDSCCMLSAWRKAKTFAAGEPALTGAMSAVVGAVRTM